VLQTNEFQRAGILIRPEPGRVSCYWAVIDPSRFRMQIWGKRSPSMDYTSEATALNAALVTNGPYFNHSSAKGGFVKYLAMGYLGECQTVAGRAALAKNVLADMQNFFDSKVIQNWTGRSFGTVSRWESEGTRAMWRALGAQCFSNRVTSDLVGERIGRSRILPATVEFLHLRPRAWQRVLQLRHRPRPNEWPHRIDQQLASRGIELRTCRRAGV
jgi:hypothetical protein